MSQSVPDKKLEEILPSGVSGDDILYVVDRRLNIVYSNEGWVQFATGNKGERLLSADWNSNVLDNMSGKAKERWTQIYGLLLEGRLPHHQEELICSSPTERRMYRLRITPKRDDAGDVAWLLHHTVRVDEAGDVVGRLSERLDDLEDPEQVDREFRDVIASRRLRIPRFRVARHFEPLDSIGGDLIWHREYPEAVADLVHGDVSGHGVVAGQLATKLVVLLDELAAVGSGPSKVVSDLNRALLEISPSDSKLFATGLFFRFEPGGQRLICSSMGHEGPIFSRTGEVKIENGPPVGLVEERKPWPENIIDLAEHGTRFLVFSDGITEQFDIEGEMFGTARLLRAFLDRLDQPLDDMVRGIVDELVRFRGTAMTKDDQTLLALELVDEPDRERVS
jgi:sigma-B regulation protein RsbU (phosphoserine phosphatase)